MPYIIQEKRDVLDPIIDELHRELVGLELDDESNNTQGNLNYIFTRLIRKIYGTAGNYQNINDALGMLFGVALEHYRTVAGPYEDQKKFDNGDVEVNVPSIVTSELIVEESNRKPTA